MKEEDGDYYDDLGALEEIEEAECWKLLASVPVGRVGVIVGQYPLIFPVNYSVVASGVVFRSATGTKLWSVEHSNVSFEVDEIDVSIKTGWSVLLRGSAREVTSHRANPELLDLVTAAAPDAWPPGDRDHLVRIVADSISGRRIRPPAPRVAEDC